MPYSNRSQVFLVSFDYIDGGAVKNIEVQVNANGFTDAQIVARTIAAEKVNRSPRDLSYRQATPHFDFNHNPHPITGDWQNIRRYRK